MPPRKKKAAAKSKTGKSPGTHINPVDPLAQILSKALNENQELRTQLLTQLSGPSNDNTTNDNELPPQGKRKQNPKTHDSKSNKKSKSSTTTDTVNHKDSENSRGQTNSDINSESSDSDSEVIARTPKLKGKKSKTMLDTVKAKKGRKSRKDLTKKSNNNAEASDSDSDGNTDSVEDSLDVNTILDSDGESDSDSELDDLGLLTELINDEVNEKWKKKIWKREFVDFNKLYYGKDESQVQMFVKKSKESSVTSVTKNQTKR